METRRLPGPLEEQPVADAKINAHNPMPQGTLAGSCYSRGPLLYIDILRYPNVRKPPSPPLLYCPCPHPHFTTTTTTVPVPLMPPFSPRRAVPHLCLHCFVPPPPSPYLIHCCYHHFLHATDVSIVAAPHSCHSNHHCCSAAASISVPVILMLFPLSKRRYHHHHRPLHVHRHCQHHIITAPVPISPSPRYLCFIHCLHNTLSISVIPAPPLLSPSSPRHCHYLRHPHTTAVVFVIPPHHLRATTASTVSAPSHQCHSRSATAAVSILPTPLLPFSTPRYFCPLRHC